MVSTRIREVADNKEMARVIDDFITQGYTVKEQGSASTKMKKSTWGSAAGWIIAFVIFIIVSIPQPSIFWIAWVILPAYAVFSHYNAPEVFIRIAQESPLT